MLQNFYPRSPRGERPDGEGNFDISTVISIHAPREGSDPRACCCAAGQKYFYPRSPRGERPGAVVDVLAKVGISIHAPREGSDTVANRLTDKQKKFLSTLPARGATVNVLSARSNSTYFYPRSPRGERLHTSCNVACSMVISIHAPREGSDRGTYPPPAAGYIFLSTLPARGATRLNPSQILWYGISIHAPREGSDHLIMFMTYPVMISIHAPREGSDKAILLPSTKWFHFYPRSPRGERRRSCPYCRPRCANFYPRSPRGERPSN